MYTKLTLLFLILIYHFQNNEIYAQISKIKYHKSRNVGLFPVIKTDIDIDSLLRTRIPDLKSSYFVFAFKLQFSEVTLAPQILNDLNIAKKYLNRGHDIVLLMLNRNTLSKTDYSSFLQKALLLKPEEARKIKIIDDETVYLKLLHSDNFQTTYYFFNRNLVYKNLGKASTHAFKDMLKYQKFSVEKDTIIIMEKPDDNTLFLKSTDKILKIEDKLYRLLGFHGAIIRYNTNGKIEKIFNINKLDPFVIYAQIEPDTFLVNYAKANNYSFLEAINRPNLQLFNLIHYNQKLYIFFILQIIIPAKYAFKVKLADGSVRKIEKNQIFSNSISMILETDLDFNILHVQHVPDDEKNNLLKTSIGSGCEIGVLMSDNKMLSQVIISNKFSDYFDTGSYAIGYYKNDNGTWNIAQIKAKYDRKLSKREEYLNYINNFLVFNQDTFITSMTFNGIYNLTKNKFYPLNPIIKHPIKKEKLLKVFDDKDTNFVNFYIIHSSTILNNNYIGVLYRFQHKDLLLEIRDKNMNVVGVIDLTKKEEFFNLAYYSLYDASSIFIDNDSLYVSYIRDDKHYLTRYKIYSYL